MHQALEQGRKRRKETSIPIKIAILDTGVNIKHPEIARAFDKKIIQHCQGFPEMLNPKADWHGHGTHVASVLMRTAPEVSLLIARVVDDEEQFVKENDYQEVANVRHFHL